MTPHFMRCALPAATLVLLPTTASAQVGPLIDWINKMSGPQFWGAEISYTFGYRPGQHLPANAIAAFALLAPAGGDDEDGAGSAQPAQQVACITPDTVAKMQFAAQEGAAFDERTVDRLRRWAPEDLGDTAMVNRFNRFSCEIAALTFRAMETTDPFQGVFSRITTFAGMDQEVQSGETYDIWTLMLRPTVGYAWRLDESGLLRPTLEIEAGFSAHYFFGDVEPFSYVSFPFLASTKLFGWHPSRLLRAFRFGGGFILFPAFPDDAFAPLFAEDDELQGTSLKPTIFFGFDFTIGW